MKVKIVKAEKASYWYASHIGEVFEVTGGGDEEPGTILYYVKHQNSDRRFLVAKEDCRPVKEEAQKTPRQAKKKISVAAKRSHNSPMREIVLCLRDLANCAESGEWQSGPHQVMQRMDAVIWGFDAALRNQGKRVIQAHNKRSDAIIADIKAVVQSWFNGNDDLTHRECDILNSVVKCYRQ